MAAPLGSRSLCFWAILPARFRACSLCARGFASSEPPKQESTEKRKTHFGFQTVQEDEKEHKGSDNFRHSQHSFVADDAF